MSAGFIDPRDERLVGAGADPFRIAETVVWVALELPPWSAPWEHPGWALCRGLAALGFGEIRLLGAGESADAFADLLAQLDFYQRPPLALSRPAAADPPDLILQLGGGALAAAPGGASASAIPAWLVVAWPDTRVTLSRGEPRARGSAAEALAPAQPLLAPVARIAAGLALQEALIFAGGLAGAAPAAPRVALDTGFPQPPAGSGGWAQALIEDAVLDVIGAGGIGTHLLESLAPLLGAGCQLRIFDGDRVETANLRGQPSYLPEDVGRPKAVAMAERLQACCDPALEILPLVMRYEDRPASLGRPSLRIACPDTFAARRYANACSLDDEAPLVEAASAPLAGQVRCYLPGLTACLEHRIPDLARRAAAEVGRDACSLEPALTLPGTNMIVAGLLACEAVRALQPERIGAPPLGTLVYDARFPQRFGVVDPRPPCAHPARRLG